IGARRPSLPALTRLALAALLTGLGVSRLGRARLLGGEGRCHQDKRQQDRNRGFSHGERLAKQDERKVKPLPGNPTGYCCSRARKSMASPMGVNRLSPAGPSSPVGPALGRPSSVRPITAPFSSSSGPPLDPCDTVVSLWM